jgi:hypothetical protein
MLLTTVPTGHPMVPDSLSFESAGNSVWAVTTDGAVVTVRLLDQRVDVAGTGYVDPVAVVPLADGVRVAVVEGDGTVWVAQRSAADRAQAWQLAQVPGGALGAARHPERDRLLILAADAIDSQPGPQLVTCRLPDGQLEVIVADLADAQALVVDDDGRATVLASSSGGSGVLFTVDLVQGGLDEVGSLPAYQHLTGSPDPSEPGVLVVAADDPNQLVLVRFDGTEAAAEVLPGPVDGLTRWGSLVLAASGQDLLAIEWGIEDGALSLAMPLGPLHVSGYARLTSDPAAAGVGPADVAYTVREGVDAGYVSAGIEPPRADGLASVMLLAGVRPGEYHLEATRNSDGSLLCVRRFRVVDLWPDPDVGPPVAVTGTHQLSLMSWGGAGASSGYLKPAPPLWRVLAVLVHLQERPWTDEEAAAARDQWKDRTVGDDESVRRFYEEVSAFEPGVHGTTMQLVGDQVLGPVAVDASWVQVFKPQDAGDLNAGWTVKQEGHAALANPISSFIADQPNGAQLMQLADTILIVVRSGSDEPVDLAPLPIELPTLYAWGHARTFDFWRQTATTFTQGPKPVSLMTSVYPAGAPPKNPTHTLCHEIGHNLGLADLYDAKGDFPAEINQRRPSWVDVMSTAQGIPHFSLGNRIRLGWVDRGWLRRFDFTANPAGGSVVLQATETLTGAGPSAGRVAGIEVPIMDDWSYLFEYRNEQPGQIGDQKLENAVAGRTRMLVGTDLRSKGGEVARPPIILLAQDADGDGPLLVNDGQDYQDSDTTNPERMHDFTLTLTDIESPDVDSARVTVEYVDAHRPQLQIRPAPGKGDFKSPDIELNGPLGVFGAPAIKGATNAIKITVHNHGSLEATDTRIHVRWLPFTVTTGPWVNLPDPAPFTVPANGLTSLVVPWPLPGDEEAEHFCVRVDIDRYRDPAHPEHEEIVVFDNWAQSNFSTGWVAFGSPSDRVATAAVAGNALGRTATYLFGADQSSDWYRTFIGHAWLRLPPGGSRPLELAYETLAGDPVAGEEFDKNLERITSMVHHVALSSWVVPEGTECGTPREVFGAGLQVRTARRAWIEDVRIEGELLVARVLAGDPNEPDEVGFGEFHLATWPEDDPERVSNTEGEVRDGLGRVRLSEEALVDLGNGRRVAFVVSRPGDNVFALAITTPALLE